MKIFYPIQIIHLRFHDDHINPMKIQLIEEYPDPDAILIIILYSDIRQLKRFQMEIKFLKIKFLKKTCNQKVLS